MYVTILYENWTELIYSVHVLYTSSYVCTPLMIWLSSPSYIHERIKFLFPFAMTIFFSPGTYRIIFSVIKKMLIPISKQFFWFRQTHWRKTWLHFHFYFLVINFRINYNCWFLLWYYHDIKLRNNLMSYSGYSVIAIYIQSIMFKVQNCRSANKKANTLYFYFFIILYCLAYTIFLECFIKINIWISGWK